jgi:hypothetical protein
VSKGRVNIDNLYKKNKENAFIADWYFYAKDKKNEITKEDMKFMLSSLHTDFTSIDKQMAVIHYLMRNGESNSAVSRLKEISASKCSYDCFMANVELGRTWYIVFKKPFLFYDNFLKKHSLYANLMSFGFGMIFAFICFISLITTIFLSWQSFKKIRISSTA